MIIKLIRHALSKQNTGEMNATQVGDCNIPLTSDGEAQSFQLGRELGWKFISGAIIYISPYLRVRQTAMGIIQGSNPRLADGGVRNIVRNIYEDLRLREVEFGFGKEAGEIAKERVDRMIHGSMFYRYNGGESPADCFDRMCSFIESMWRQIERKKATRVLIVSHGMAIRCFVTRFLHLRVEQFDTMHNPHNCDVITIAPKYSLPQYQFSNGKWGVDGIRIRDKERLRMGYNTHNIQTRLAD
jgi:broad specificity phosphatase PhoE